MPSQINPIKRETLFLGVIIFFLVNGIIPVQQASGTSPKGDTVQEKPKSKTKKMVPNKAKKGKRYLRMNEIEIRGEIEKPKAMFVVPRAPHIFSRHKSEKDYTAEIVVPIRKGWVDDMYEWQQKTPSP